MNTPIITGADAEGAGEMFGVTNFDLNQIPRDENVTSILHKISLAKNQFDGFWSVRSGNCSDGIGKSLYFYRTFRAENSNTKSPCRILDGRTRSGFQ